MDESDEEISRKAMLTLTGLGAAVTLGFLAFWVFLDRDVDPLYRPGAGEERVGTIQEELSTEVVRGARPVVQVKPLAPPEGVKRDAGAKTGEVAAPTTRAVE